LSLYRRLIHLRKRNEALATGRLVPLAAGNGSVAAYLRRTGNHVVLVVANLGGAPLSGVAIASAERVLPPGRYAPRSLLDGPDGALLQVRRDGRVRDYVAAATLAPRQTLVLDLVRR
jgi:hypothetical protein